MAKTIRPDYLRKPVAVPPWPPAGWEKRHLVQAGQSWASLAALYHRASPWDLIIYNFRTTSVAETNWCMAYFLGCNEATDDGRSFHFASAGRHLYVPPADWRPGMAVPPAHPAGDAAAARRAVIEVLEAADHMPFAFMLQGHIVSSGLLRRVARAVEDGRIGVAYDPAVRDGRAEYDSGGNEFRVKFTAAPTRERQGLIVHEGVHAGMDLMKLGVVSGRFSEAAAYVAQCVYVRQRMTFDEILNKHRLSEDDNRVIDVAWPIAGKLMDGKPVTSTDEALLFAAVLRTPAYRNAVAASYDGV